MAHLNEKRRKTDNQGGFMACFVVSPPANVRNTRLVFGQKRTAREELDNTPKRARTIKTNKNSPIWVIRYSILDESNIKVRQCNLDQDRPYSLRNIVFPVESNRKRQGKSPYRTEFSEQTNKVSRRNLDQDMHCSIRKVPSPFVSYRNSQDQTPLRTEMSAHKIKVSRRNMNQDQHSSLKKMTFPIEGNTSTLDQFLYRTELSNNTFKGSRLNLDSDRHCSFRRNLFPVESNTSRVDESDSGTESFDNLSEDSKKRLLQKVIIQMERLSLYEDQNSEDEEDLNDSLQNLSDFECEFEDLIM